MKLDTPIPTLEVESHGDHEVVVSCKGSEISITTLVVDDVPRLVVETDDGRDLVIEFFDDDEED